MNPQRIHPQSGFTLLELLAVIAIVTVLTAIAVPSFDFLNNRRITQTQVENLQRSLTMARQTALSKNRQVALCPSANGDSCIDSQDWSSGYLVFVDADANEAFESARGDQRLEFVYGVRNVAGRMSSENFQHRLVADTRRIEFNAAGFNNGIIKTFNYCDASGEGKFLVRVLNTGRIKVEESDEGCD